MRSAEVTVLGHPVGNMLGVTATRHTKRKWVGRPGLWRKRRRGNSVGALCEGKVEGAADKATQGAVGR